jgi:hypothetical protein
MFVFLICQMSIVLENTSEKLWKEEDVQDVIPSD